MIIVTACLLALWLPDQTAVRYTATIAVPEAELRAGPSNDTKLYTTNKLRQGDTVVVVEERPDGWLAVRPLWFIQLDQRTLPSTSDADPAQLGGQCTSGNEGHCFGGQFIRHHGAAIRGKRVAAAGGPGTCDWHGGGQRRPKMATC